MKKLAVVFCLSSVIAGFFIFGVSALYGKALNKTSVHKSSHEDKRGCFFSNPALIGLLSCFNTTNTDPFCMQTNAFFMTDRRSHNAPVQSVAWLCDSPVGTYAAIGGFPENNIVGATDARVYKFNPDSGLLGDPIANLTHGSYVFGVSWVYILDYDVHDYGAFLAVGGYPSSIDDNEIHIFHLDTSINPPAVNPVPVASYKHGAPIKSVSWLGCGLGDTAYLAIGGQAGIDGAEIRILKFKASDNSLTLLANRFHGAPINSVSWYYNPVQFPAYPPILAVGGDPVEGVPVSGPNYITVRLYTFNCTSESLQDLIFGSQPNPAGTNEPPTRVFGVKPSILNVDLFNQNALFVGVACGSTLTNQLQSTFTPGYLLAFFPPVNNQDASLDMVLSFSVPGISQIPVNGYAVDFNSSCTCGGSVMACCPQITFGLGCPKDTTEPLPLNIFTVGFIQDGSAYVYTKFDDNITSLEWCKVDDGKISYMLVGSEANNWNVNSLCTGNEIAVYRALIVCRSTTTTAPHVWLNSSKPQAGPPPGPWAWGKSCLCAHKECRRFPVQADLANVLTWTAVTGATSYNLYRFLEYSDFVVANMTDVKQALKSLTLLATIPANCPLIFKDHCIQKCQQVNYLLSATNSAAVESPVAIIQI